MLPFSCKLVAERNTKLWLHFMKKFEYVWSYLYEAAKFLPLSFMYSGNCQIVTTTTSGTRVCSCPCQAYPTTDLARPIHTPPPKKKKTPWGFMFSSALCSANIVEDFRGCFCQSPLLWPADESHTSNRSSREWMRREYARPNWKLNYKTKSNSRKTNK